MNDVVAHPPIASRDEWLASRRELLVAEKELTRQYDRINAQRRRLPMVRKRQQRASSNRIQSGKRALGTHTNQKFFTFSP